MICPHFTQSQSYLNKNLGYVGLHSSALDYLWFLVNLTTWFLVLTVHLTINSSFINNVWIDLGFWDTQSISAFDECNSRTVSGYPSNYRSESMWDLDLQFKLVLCSRLLTSSFDFLDILLILVSFFTLISFFDLLFFGFSSNFLDRICLLSLLSLDILIISQLILDSKLIGSVLPKLVIIWFFSDNFWHWYGFEISDRFSPLWASSCF